MYWHKDMTLEEAKILVGKCITCLKTRFIANLPDFVIKVVDKDGVREIEL